MRGTVISRLRLGARKLLRDQRGNAFIMTAFAIIPIVGIVGSSVDIGRGYMAQLRLQQACDAGVLAGRRSMAAGQWTQQAKKEAQKMFEFNYPRDTYGSTTVAFNVNAQSSADVSGTATAFLPTHIMSIWPFFNDGFNLSANCTAKLEISNTDVMLVLDVTGSMSTLTAGKSRMQALQEGAMVFFDTITSAAQIGDGRLRIGIVPYSSSANVGRILLAENSNWISDNMLLPSRSPVMRYNWGSGDPPASVTTGTTTEGSWNDLMVASGQTTSAACAALTPPADSMPTSAVTPDANRTTFIVDRNGTRRFVNNAGTAHSRYNYRYNWNWVGSRCVLQRRTVSFTHNNSANPTSTAFNNRYRYEDRVFDVSAVKNGSQLTADTGDSGASRSYTWGGCVMERRTSPFGATSSPPSEALDMDVDLVPQDEESRWQMLIPEVAFPRGSTPSNTPSSTGVVEINPNNTTVTSETSKGGSWRNYWGHWDSGWGVCPAEAIRLTEMDKNDRSFFEGRINLLRPVGGTYHDSGMVWGVRFISPDGLFAGDNATAPNGRPINRHIIFMTDGAMSPDIGNLSFQGYEYLMQRVGGSFNSTKAQLTTRHNNRFNRLCAAAQDKNITIWVIAFDLDSGSDVASLRNCSTTQTIFQPRTPTDLANVFADIAGQISRLRLSK